MTSQVQQLLACFNLCHHPNRFIKKIHIESLIIQGPCPTTRGWRRRVRFPVLLDSERLSAAHAMWHHVVALDRVRAIMIVSSAGFGGGGVVS